MKGSEKSCTNCGRGFICGASNHETCWCVQYPQILKPDSETQCMCQICLHQTIKEYIFEYTTSLSPEEALRESKAKELPKTDKLIHDIDFYPENGKVVFTAWYHLKRGSCCANNCRHCPYGYKEMLTTK